MRPSPRRRQNEAQARRSGTRNRYWVGCSNPLCPDSAERKSAERRGELSPRLIADWLPLFISKAASRVFDNHSSLRKHQGCHQSRASTRFKVRLHNNALHVGGSMVSI